MISLWGKVGLGIVYIVLTSISDFLKFASCEDHIKNHFDTLILHKAENCLYIIIVYQPSVIYESITKLPRAPKVGIAHLIHPPSTLSISQAAP